MIDLVYHLDELKNFISFPFSYILRGGGQVQGGGGGGGGLLGGICRFV
jgi:hypothetical protein